MSVSNQTTAKQTSNNRNYAVKNNWKIELSCGVADLVPACAAVDSCSDAPSIGRLLQSCEIEKNNGGNFTAFKSLNQKDGSTTRKNVLFINNCKSIALDSLQAAVQAFDVADVFAALSIEEEAEQLFAAF